MAAGCCQISRLIFKPQSQGNQRQTEAIAAASQISMTRRVDRRGPGAVVATTACKDNHRFVGIFEDLCQQLAILENRVSLEQKAISGCFEHPFMSPLL